MAGLISSQDYLRQARDRSGVLDSMQQRSSRANQLMETYGVDWWSKKKRELDHSSKEINDYFNSGNTTAEDTARFREQAQGYYDSLSKDMDSYGSGSNRYKELKSYRDYYQNVLGGLRQDDLQRSTKGFDDYLSGGKYTAEGNNKYRSEAEQAIKDLDEEMKGLNKDSDYYKMLSGYRDEYDRSLKAFDRTDAGASTIDYINADAWHSPEDFAIQKQLVQDNIDMLTQEMEASEDQESDEYKALAAYKEWYEGLLTDLDTRKAQDDYFTETGKAKGITGEENYVSWQKRNDYGYATQLGKTLKEKEEELKRLNPDYANLSDAAFNRLIKDAEQELEIAQAMGGPSDYDAAKKKYDSLVSAQELVGQVNQLRKDQDVLRGHQVSAILYEHYKGYDKNTDYQKLVDTLNDQLAKAKEGTEDYEKLRMELLAIAGVNGDGTNENGLYDEYTWLGRQIMENFDAKAAEVRLAEIKEEMQPIQEEINGLSMGVVGDDVTDLNARYKELTTKQAALRSEKRDLQQKLNSSNDLKERNRISENIAAVPPEEAAKLIEAGKGVVKTIGDGKYAYYSEKVGYGSLPNFEVLDDEYGAEIRDAIYMALGAKETGADAGFTVDDVLKAYQSQINEIGGMKDAKKIDEMENGAARWLRQEIGVGLLGGVQRHFEDLPSFFKDEVAPITRSGYKLQHTKALLGERYGEGNFPGGQNFSQTMLDVMDTTGNMLPGMLLSWGIGAGLGAAGGALEAAGHVAAGAKLAGAAATVGKIAGGLEMGVSSAGRSYQQALREGWAVEDARTYGAIIGTAESTMQYLISGIPGMVGMPGLAEEGLLRTAQMIDNAAVRIATKTAINIGSEVTEELAQNKLQSALDYYMFGKGDENWLKWTEEDWNTVLVTVLSTALMETGPQIKSDVSATKTGRALAGGKELKPGLIDSKATRARKLQINAIGEEMKGNEALAYTLETLAQDLDPDSEAYKLVEKANKHESAKTANYYGTLFNALLEDGGDPNKTMVAIIGGAQAYHLGNAAQETVKTEQAKLDALRKENPGATVLDATASKLMENGVRSSTEAAEMSVVVNKILSGKNLTKDEMQAVTGSSTAAKAARVVLSEYNSTFTADMSPQVAESAVNYLTADMRTKKNQERERLRTSVLQAAMNAASGLEKNRATAGADLGWRRGMTQGSIVQNAVGEKDTSWSTKGAAAQSVDAETAKKYVGAVRGRDVASDTLAKLRNTSFADLAVLSESEMAAMFGKSEAVALQGMIDRQAQLKNREASLLHSQFPTKAKKTELADIRQEMAELNARAAGIIQSARQRAAQAAVEEEKAQAEAAQNTAEEKPGTIPPKAAARTPAQGDKDTVVLPGTKGAVTTREEFVNSRVEAAKAAGKDAEAARAKANSEFDDMVALTTGQEIGAEKGEDNNGRQQATDRNEARNDLGEQRDRAEDRKRGDRSEQGAVGGNEAPRTRALSTASGKEAAKVTDGAVETTGENAAGLESKYPGVEKLAKYLVNSGVKRVVYVTDGQILNAAGQPVAGVYYDGEIFLNLNYKGGYHYSVTADHERMHARLALYKAALAERYGNDEAAQAKALAETREFVASTLESILGQDTYADAFGKYWDSYAEPYMKAGAKPEDIMYMVCEEMLSDMVAGMNNFGAQLGIYANEANDFLETSHFDAATKSIVSGESPVSLEYELPADNNMPFGLTFKELRPGDVKDAFKNETDTDAPPEQRPLPGDEPMHPELSLLSRQSLTEGTGLKLRYNDLGYVDAVIDPKTGEEVTEVTPEMMANTPLGKLVQDAIIKTDDNGKIISGHITQEQADAEYKLLADAMNLITRYNDAPLVWEVVGSQLFSGVKKNSDTQYNYTIDFGTICRKTQAIVNVMSETMKYLKRGLSRREVEEVYLAVGKAREATPCPVCYVFSRWMGIGGLLDQINRYQNEYFDINQKTGEFTWKVDKQQILEFMRTQEDLAEQHVKDILKDKQAAVDKARAELEALSPNADEETRTKAEEKLAKAEKSLENKRKDFLDENGYLKYGGILSDMKSNSAIDGAIQKINQLDQGDRLNEELLAKMDNATPEQQKKFRDIIKKNIQNKRATIKAYAPAELAAYDALAKEFNAINRKNKIKKDNFTAEQRAELDAAMLRATEAAKDGLDKALAAARAENDPVEKYQWLAKTVLSLKPGVKGERIWEFNEDYKPVKQEILFDLNKGADFAKDYPLTWGFRTGKGCAMGKAIMPYSDARVGETLQGVASGETKGLINNNPFLNGEELQRADVVTKARAWARRQNLIGGMRYQSTSDFRFEWGSDYLITFFELQAIGANVQLYTKVIEAVDFLASTHSDCNLSVMPLGDGYKQVGTRQVGTDKDGKPILEPIYELIYSGTTGIDKDAALEKVHQYDNVQLILVGINDLNIRLALASEDVTFVIPFHGSGQSVHQVQTLMDLLRENLDVNKARDYSDVQTDHFKKTRTAEEKAMWNLRMDIIMGNCLGGLTEEQQALIAKNKHLDKLYNMFYKQTENKAYHCFLAKEQAGQIFPYEYWDTTTTYATADRNGQIFQDYCESMGIIPRFSGKDSSGKDVGFGDFTGDKGYWKLLIDRKMYANTYDEVTGKWTGYGNYRDQEKVTTDNIKIGMLDESTVAEGRGDWATATAIPEGARTKPIRSEKTQAIMMEAIYGTEDPDDKIQVTGIRNLEKARLNEIDRTKMTKGFRERYLDAKSELRNVPAVPEEIPVYALAMTDPGYETSKREAPVTDDRGQVLFVEPNTAGWSVDRDTDGSLLNTDYIIDELGMPIFRNPKDAYAPPEKRDVVPPKHRTSNPSTQDTYKHIFEEYIPETYGDGAKDLLVVDASSGLGLGANLGKQKLGEENVIDLEPYPGSRTPVPDYKEYGGLIHDMENGQKRKADFIISNAVINVMAQDAREEHLAALLRMMDDNGTVYINPAFPKRGWDAYKKAIPLEEYKQRKANGEDVSKLNVMLVPDTKTTGAEIYTASSKSVQKGYAPEEFIAFAKDVAKQTLGYDVDVRRANGVNGLKTGFLITKAGSTAPESSRFSIQLTPEQESRRAYNERQTETGSGLKTLNGDKPMTRSKTKVNGVPANVGKQMGDQIWVHKQYVDRVVPKDILDHARAVLAEKYPNFQYNTIMYDKKTGNVRFDEAPNFDTAREPIPGGMVTVMPNGGTKVNYNDQIWHHKWMWVDNDYKGFDVDESWNWSKQWLSELQEPANGSTRGPVGWDGQMEKYGLPTDPASEVEIKDKKAEIARIEGKQTKPTIPAKNAPKNSTAPALKPTGENTTIYIKDGHRGDGSTVDFINEILDGNKKYETRDHNRLTRQWVGMAKDGKVYGRVKLGDPIVLRKYDANGNLTQEYKDSMIEGTEYDIKDNETKYAYPIEAVEDYRDNPKPVTKNGNYGRYSIQGEPATEQQAQAYYSQQDAKANEWAPEFYSKMQRTIEEWTGNNGKPMGAKMGANQVLGWLKGKGVKAEEIKWSGIIPFLEGKKSVTKDELLAVMAENEIKIETKVLGGGGFSITTPGSILVKSYANGPAVRERLREIARKEGVSSDQLVLKRLGNESMITAVSRSDTGEWVADIFDDSEERPLWGGYTVYEDGLNYREILFKDRYLLYKNSASVTHWKKDASGTLAHARVEDAAASDGSEVLMVEEIQSDLHNALARYGGRLLEGEEAEMRDLYQDKNNIGAFYRDKDSERYYELFNKKIQPFSAAKEKAREKMQALIPDDVDDAYDRVSNALNDAGYTNYDAVSWLGGEIKSPLTWDAWEGEAEMPSQEDQDEAERIAFEALSEEEAAYVMAGREYTRAWKSQDEEIKRLQETPPDVPFAGSSDTYHEYVMKHLLRLAAEGGYDRLAWTTAQQQSNRWSDDFAEGYRIEYDQNIPKFMNKYVKQWGGKVGTTTLDNGDEVWSVDITPEMRDSVLTKGQPLFSIQNTGSSSSTPLYAEGSLESDLLDLVRMGPEAVSNFANEALANHEDALEAAKMHAPPIPSKGFVPDVTDSERGVLNRMLQQRIKEVGAQRPSEKSNGFLIPKGYKRFHQNVGSAKNLPGYAHDLNLRQLMTTTEATYVPTSNKQLMKGAEEDVGELGYEGALAAYKRNAKSISLSTKDLLKTIALGEQLIHEAASNRDGANLLDVTASLALLGNVAGKSLQAFKLLKQMGPLGELYYVEKAIDRINKENEDLIRHAKGKEIVAKKELCDAVLNAETEEDRNEAMDALIADLASQCPVTLRDRWNAWRYLSMLGNARTHIRNIIGNAVFVPLRYTKDLIAAGGELLATKAGWMEEADRRKALMVSRELRDFALADADVFQKELQGNGKYNPAQEILSRRKLLPGFLNTLSNANGNALEYEDWMFLRGAYARALSMQLTHLGYSIDELQASPEGQKALNEARKIAIEEAQKATYRDFCAVASWLNRGKQMKGAAGTIVSIGLEGVLPFTKTPINILRRGVEYSPLGIAKGIGTILDGVRSGEVDVAEAIDQLAAGLSGTAIAALGWLLARMGVLRGKKSDDDEENFDKLQGYQDYSLQIGDQSFTIDWMAPTALPLFTGAAIADLMDEDHELSWGDAWNAMIMIAEPMTSLSMLDGLNKLIESTAYASGNEKIATIATQAATSYLGQAFPTILGQVARSIDGTRRSTYIDKNSPIPAAGQRFVQSSVQNKIPGWESAKVPYIDAWGRQSEAGSKVLNGIENFFMPYYRSVKNTTDVDEELQRLYKDTKADVLPSVPQKYFSIGDNQKKYLTADEWVSYATDIGQTKYELMTQLISDPRYLALTDAEKAKVIKDYIYKYATTAGKYHIYSDYDIRHQGVWIQEAEAARTSYERFERIWQQIEKGLKD